MTSAHEPTESRFRSSIAERLRRAVTDRGPVVWALADQMVVSGISFLSSILVARCLGLEDFGRFALAWVAVFVCQNLHGALITGPLMTLGAAWKTSGRRAYLGAVLQHQAIFSVAAMGTVYLGLAAAGGLVPSWGLGNLALPVAALAAAGSWSEFLRHYFYAGGKARDSFMQDLIRYGAQFALLAGLLAAGWIGVAGTFAAMAATAAIASLAGLFRLPRPAFEPAVAADVTRRHWRFAKWLLASTGTGAAREGLISLAVGVFAGLSEVGLLRAAQQLVLAVNVPLQGLGKLAQSGASLAYAGRGTAGLDLYMQSFVATYLALIAAALLPMAIWSAPLLLVTYGAPYTAAAGLLAGYSAVMLLCLGREALAIRLRAMHLTALEFHASLAGAMVSIAAIVPLLQAFGVAGAVVAEALFNAIALMTALGLLWRQRRQHSGGAERAMNPEPIAPSP